MILIGAGTGVSPFLGFLDHVTSHVTLITGNRHRELDSIYEREFGEHFTAEQEGRNWYRAFSRDEGSKWRYVQDVVRDKGEELVNGIVDEGAAVYVCGDAKGLGVGVWEAFVEVVGKWTGRSKEESEGYLKELRTSKRYCEDIWS